MNHIPSRRHFLQDGTLGLRGMALASLWGGGLPAAIAATGEASPGHPALAPHFAPRAKAVIHLFMTGAPSHLDLFDNKPKLKEFEGRSIPPEVIGGQRYAFINSSAQLWDRSSPFTGTANRGLRLQTCCRISAKLPTTSA